MNSRYEKIVIIFMWVVFLAFVNAPGRMEGKFIPILDNFEYQVSGYENSNSRVYLEFDKIRANCGFRSIDFYLNEIDENGVEQTVKLNAIFGGSDQTRFAGKHTGVGPWYVNATPRKLQNVSIFSEHRCHAGFMTITRYRVTDGVAERI